MTISSYRSSFSRRGVQEVQFWCTRPARHSSSQSRSCERHFSNRPSSSVEVDYAEPKHGQVKYEKGDTKESTSVALACDGDYSKTVEESSEKVLTLPSLQMSELSCRSVRTSNLLISRGLMTKYSRRIACVASIWSCFSNFISAFSWHYLLLRGVLWVSNCWFAVVTRWNKVIALSCNRELWFSVLLRSWRLRLSVSGSFSSRLEASFTFERVSSK